jgi:very-short-patch-repair endonuclease
MAKSWREVAAGQAGLLTRAQLKAAGVDRWAVAHRIRSERWQDTPSPRVVATTTGPLSVEQSQWLGVLHARQGALLGGLTAAEADGLTKWHRDTITVLTPYESGRPAPLEGFAFVRTRRSVTDLRAKGSAPPRCRLEPALLLFAAGERNKRTAQGVLAAAVQQRLTTATRLLSWLDDLAPLRQAALLRTALEEIAGGAQSLAEIDVKRMCRTHRLRPPDRQVKHRDSEGRVRYTDCEWRLADGRTVVLEVDGGFHMDVEQWEDDIARQRALTAPDRILVRCTSRELRDEPERVARDLIVLGVPRAA